MEHYEPKYITVERFNSISDCDYEVWSDKLAKAISKGHTVLYKYLITEGARDSMGRKVKRCFIDLELMDKVLEKNPAWIKLLPESIDYSFSSREPLRPLWHTIAKSPYRCKVKSKENQANRQRGRVKLGLKIEDKDWYK